MRLDLEQTNDVIAFISSVLLEDDFAAVVMSARLHGWADNAPAGMTYPNKVDRVVRAANEQGWLVDLLERLHQKLPAKAGGRPNLDAWRTEAARVEPPSEVATPAPPAADPPPQDPAATTAALEEASRRAKRRRRIKLAIGAGALLACFVSVAAGWRWYGRPKLPTAGAYACFLEGVQLQQPCHVEALPDGRRTLRVLLGRPDMVHEISGPFAPAGDGWSITPLEMRAASDDGEPEHMDGGRLTLSERDGQWQGVWTKQRSQTFLMTPLVR